MSPAELEVVVGTAFDQGARTALIASIEVLAKHPRKNRRALQTLRGILARFDESVMGQ